MNPETIMLAIIAVANATSEALKFAQTEQGMKLIDPSLKDRAAWDKGIAELGGWFKNLFSGELFRAELKRPDAR